MRKMGQNKKIKYFLISKLLFLKVITFFLNTRQFLNLPKIDSRFYFSPLRGRLLFKVDPHSVAACLPLRLFRPTTTGRESYETRPGAIHGFLLCFPPLLLEDIVLIDLTESSLIFFCRQSVTHFTMVHFC